MNVIDWFDLDNIEHLKAYKHLEDTGRWPEDFIPEGLTYVPLWQVTLRARMADRFMKEKLSSTDIDWKGRCSAPFI